jgi:C1A family cysteine protease
MTEPRKIARYGWIPDLPDDRDHLYAAPPVFLSALPPFTDLRMHCPEVYDQGQLGSCTANAIGGAIEFERLKQNLPDYVPSRLFIYYNERVIEGTVNSDSGAMIRDGIKSVASQGVCPEPEWPYDISKFTEKPPAKAYSDAKSDRAVSYQSLVQDLNQMRGCLASGYPFIFGFTVYESFESQTVAQTGHVPMPGPLERAVGGHAVMAVGYDDASQSFLVRNSWGAAWGIAGYFTMPYTYLIQDGLASDLWTIRIVGA